MNYRISEFCHFVSGENGFVALYNALTLGVVIVTEQIADVLKSASGRIVSSESFAFLDEQERDDRTRDGKRGRGNLRETNSTGR